MNPKVAIVIVNWNKKEFVLRLLTQLQMIDYDNFDIIIVDNASTDGSVEAIRERFPNLKLIVNKENLGGTGGFNTGMRYFLKNNNFVYKYIWLLDNDAEVEIDTLKELVKAMEEDEKIGIAGSRIIDINSRDITIEAGAFFRWDTIGVKPLFRNKKNIQFSHKTYEVDYVAICSALVRTKAIEEAGFMDDRFFIFWDDMDWGLQFKKNNFKVVSVFTSVAYHPAFTEKRSPLVDFYYGYRNALLTYAKHSGLLQRLPIYLRHIRYCSKVLFFLGLTGRWDLMCMGFAGIKDFLIGRWGGKTFKTKNKELKKIKVDSNKEINKIIFLNTGNREDIYNALKAVKVLFPKARCDLIMQDDRADIFSKEFNNIIFIKRDNRGGLIYLFFIFLKILIRNYDLAVIPNYPSPFSFSVKKVCHYNPITNDLVLSNENLKNIWKLFLSVIFGEVVSIFLLPPVYVRSLIYNKSQHE
ncbi:MAG: glycosyltransferase family 2 protein [Nitrospirae bacterium]|jgi:GT2 family glycosyltransferase|nr:glycosyltransferase family 2 protein [Nitrospirota bacterium]